MGKIKHILHKQVPTKVTAYVDEGIKDLVDAFNAIPHIATIESCQGHTEYTKEETTRPFAGKACVIMTWAANYQCSSRSDEALNAVAGLARFAQRLTSAIWDYDQAHPQPNGFDLSLTMSTYLEMSWNGFNVFTEPQRYHYGSLVVWLKPSVIPEITEIVHRLIVDPNR